MSRRATEINKRVRALDRVVAEVMVNAPTLRELRELGRVSVPALNAEVALEDHKLPLFTLEHAVQSVCIKRGLTTWGWNLAIGHALRAHRNEPNLDVCATWAVDQVMSLQALARVDLVGGTLWKEGRPVGGINDDRALPNDALLQVREIPPIFRDLGSQVVLCDWQPEHASAGANLLFHAEEDRPPVEAMKLIAEIINQQGDCDRILGLGLGHSSAAQVLSHHVPWARFHAWYSLRQDAPAIDEVDVVVLNVCEANTLTERSEVTNGKRRIRREVRGGDGTVVFETKEEVLDQLLAHARRLLKPGTQFFLLSEPVFHELLVDYFRGMADLGVHPVTDTSNRAIYFGYRDRPWTPRGFDAPTDRLLSCWVVR